MRTRVFMLLGLLAGGIACASPLSNLAPSATGTLWPTPPYNGTLYATMCDGFIDNTSGFQSNLIPASGTDVFWHKLLWPDTQSIGCVLANTEYAYQQFRVQALSLGADPDQETSWYDLGQKAFGGKTATNWSFRTAVRTRGLRLVTDEAKGGVAARWNGLDYESFTEVYAFRERVREVGSEPGTYSQSQAHGGYEASRMFDRNTEGDNCWATDTAPPQWGQVIWNTAKDVDAVIVNSYHIGETRNPSAYNLYLHIGGAWLLADAVAGWNGNAYKHEFAQTYHADGLKIEVTAVRGSSLITVSEILVCSKIPAAGTVLSLR